MDQRATGIILRKRRLTETSLIVHWLTGEHGRIATVARGALRPRSPFRGKLDVFYECELVFVRSRKSELHTLKEAVARETHPVLRENLAKLRQAAYAAALIEQTTEMETAVTGEFQLLQDFLGALPALPDAGTPVLAFELKLLHQLGQAPDLASTRLSEGVKRIAGHLTGVGWHALPNLKVSGGQAQELQRFLHGFLIYHLGRLPKGRPTALASVAGGAAGTPIR